MLFQQREALETRINNFKQLQDEEFKKMRDGIEEGLRRCLVVDTKLRDLEGSLGSRVDKCF